MKCNYCGYNLNIEDIFCPHCGKPNEHVKQHVADMNKFQQEFEETKEEVIENSKKFNMSTARIAIIFALIALVAIASCLYANRVDLRYTLKEKDVNKHAKEHIEAVERLEAERNYLELDSYFQLNNLIYADCFSEYERVEDCSRIYRYIYDSILRLNPNVVRTGSQNVSDECLNISRSITNMNNYMTMSANPREKEQAQFAPRHVEYMADIKQEVQDTVQYYFGLTDEEAESIWTMKQTKLAVFLEDKAEIMGYGLDQESEE